MFYHNPLQRATPAQIARLRELGVPIPARLNKPQADRLIKENYDRWASAPATSKQASYLRGKGLWRADMTRGEAAHLIRRLTGNQDWPLGQE